MIEDAINHLQSDSDLRPLIEEHGEIGLNTAEDSFKRFTVSIINQQLSTASASAIRDRVFDQFEVNPQAMLEADEAALRETGLSRQKIEYIRNIAEAYIGQGLGPEYFEGMDDSAVISELTDIKGVGPWSAKMYLLFCLGRPDVFPVEDLGIRKGMYSLYTEEMDRDEMFEVAEKWRPYRSYASRYIWRAYDG